MTREQMIDEAVRRVDHANYWRSWLDSYVLHHENGSAPVEQCATCRAHFWMIRDEFQRIAGTA